jgi:hypothetical protein
VKTSDLPQLSRQVTIGRNSNFYNLSEEDRERLGGIEYRALRLLLKFVSGMFLQRPDYIVQTLILQPKGTLLDCTFLVWYVSCHGFTPRLQGTLIGSQNLVSVDPGGV